MRTKTLLIAAAALAATVISSEAQVYSANIVGYVNLTCPANTLVMAANPLDNGTNDLNSLLGALPNKSQVQYWNGSGFTVITKGATWVPSPVIPAGTGLFIKSATATNITFVGNVACPVGGSATNSLLANTLYMVGNTVPYAGDLNSTNIGLNVLPNKSQVQFWNGSGFTVVTKGATWPSNNIDVGQGFFVKSAAATNWIQSLPSN